MLPNQILDFGLARSNGLDPVRGNQPVHYSPYVGSRAYQAPEVALGLPYHARWYDVDIWSAGCIFAELFLGEMLFPVNNDWELFRLIVRELGEPPEEITGLLDINVSVFMILRSDFSRAASYLRVTDPTSSHFSANKRIA